MVVFSTTAISAPFIASAAVSAAAAAVVVVAVLCLLLANGLLGAKCFHCIALSVSLPFFFPTSPPLLLRQGSGSLRPCHRREPVRLPFWLLARFVGGLAPSACVVRRPYESTMRDGQDMGDMAADPCWWTSNVVNVEPSGRSKSSAASDMDTVRRLTNGIA